MNRKFFKIVISVMLLVSVCATISSALSFSVTMTPSSKVVQESTEFTVEVKVSNLDVGANGINTLSGTLIYDQDVFETIEASSIEGRNGWNPNFSIENGKITLTKMSFVKSDEDVFQVTFKTKSADALRDNKGLIQFKTILASNSASEISASDVSIEITVGDPSTESGNVSVTTNNAVKKTNSNIGITPSNKINSNTNAAKNTSTNTNTNTNTNTRTNTNTNTNTNKTTSYVNKTNTTDGDIPYAGAEDYMLYFVGAALAIAIVFYIKFERINKEMK